MNLKTVGALLAAWTVAAGCASEMSLRDTLELLGVYFITGEVRGVSLHLDKMRASTRRIFA